MKDCFLKTSARLISRTDWRKVSISHIPRKGYPRGIACKTSLNTKICGKPGLVWPDFIHLGTVDVGNDVEKSARKTGEKGRSGGEWSAFSVGEFAGEG